VWERGKAREEGGRRKGEIISSPFPSAKEERKGLPFPREGKRSKSILEKGGKKGAFLRSLLSRKKREEEVRSLGKRVGEKKSRHFTRKEERGIKSTWEKSSGDLRREGKAPLLA